MSLTSNQFTAELLTIHFQQMLVRWGQDQPPRTGLHASSVLVSEQEWCLRKHILAANETVKQSFDASWRTNALFLHGWMVHEKWQRLFQQFAQVVEIETSHFDEERQLHFTPDAVIEFAQERYIVEIKGFKATTFVSLQTPPKAAVTQANLYMHLMNIHQAIVLVENKDTQEFKLWVISYDPTLVKMSLNRIDAVKAARKRAGLPDRVCQSKQDTLALRCPVREYCFSGGALHES